MISVDLGNELKRPSGIDSKFTTPNDESEDESLAEVAFQDWDRHFPSLPSPPRSPSLASLLAAASSH